MDIYNGFNLDIPYGPVSAKVNNKVEGLNYRAYNNKDVEFLNILSSSGMRTYVRSLCFVLCKAVEDLYPDGSIVLEHPVSKGYYCDLHIGREIGLDDVQRIKKRTDIVDTQPSHLCQVFLSQIPHQTELAYISSYGLKFHRDTSCECI